MKFIKQSTYASQQCMNAIACLQKSEISDDEKYAEAYRILDRLIDNSPEGTADRAVAEYYKSIIMSNTKSKKEIVIYLKDCLNRYLNARTDEGDSALVGAYMTAIEVLTQLENT